MAGGARHDDDEDGGPPPTAQPPWIRRDRSVQRFAARIGISVVIGVAVAAFGPMIYAILAAPDLAAIAAVPTAQWPECQHLSPRADACWYRVANRSTLTITDAAALLDVPAERLRIMNPNWIGVGTAPQRIVIWRGNIAGGGQ